MREKKQIWGNHLSESPEELFVHFCSGRDTQEIAASDEELAVYDILTNLTQIHILKDLHVLDAEEAVQLEEGLKTLFRKVAAGEFRIDPDKEDIHVAVEHYLTFELAIAAGGKIHTGRSRNDQVATDIRMYVRDAGINFLHDLAGLIKVLTDKAEEHENSIMPGFTHYQPAMPTTFAHWMLSWAWGFFRDANRVLATIELNDECPLGAAASFGTTWNPDREKAAWLLGFGKPQENTLDCITSRGEFETGLAADITICLNRFGVVAQDLIFLSHPYTGFLKIPDRFLSGSSIMPQKKNLDFAEIIRSKASFAAGICTALFGASKGVMSGYNRDSQYTKPMIMDFFRECGPIPSVMTQVIGGITADKNLMKKRAEENFLNAADSADFLAKETGMPFRKAYEIIALTVGESGQGFLDPDILLCKIKEISPESELNAESLNKLKDVAGLVSVKTHTGAPSPLAVRNSREKLRASLSDFSARLHARQSVIQNAYDGLLGSGITFSPFRA